MNGGTNGRCGCEEVEAGSGQLRCVCGHRGLRDLGPCRRPSAGPRGTGFERDLGEQFRSTRLYRCQQCFLGLRLPRPDDTTLASLYDSLPVSRWENGVVRGTAQNHVIRWCRRKHGLRVLDVGAFDGSFLAALPGSFQKSAIEPSAAADVLGRRGIQVLKPFLTEPTPCEAGTFDVVTTFDVFEHLADPLSGMQQLMAYVRPGGSLFVGTGNLDHWSVRLNAGDHWYLDPLQHIVVGGVRHFKWQAGQLNTRSVRIHPVSHQRGSIWNRWQESLMAVYFGLRGTGGWSGVAAKLLGRLPSVRRFACKQAMPYTQHIRDHVLVEFVRGS